MWYGEFEFKIALLNRVITFWKEIVKKRNFTKKNYCGEQDEYDVFVREQVKGNISDNLFEEYLRFLNGLFKNDTLKPAIAGMMVIKFVKQ